jgi:lysophospholipase L1-like esterase
MKRNLFISISLNVFFLVLSVLWIANRGGVDYVKIKLGLQKEEEFNNYYRIKESIFEAFPINKYDNVFVGNSLTDYAPWDELFLGISIKNRGIATDDIRGVQHRIDGIIKGQPKSIFLMLGTNDLEYIQDLDSILNSYKNLVEHIATQTPATQLFLQSVLPTKGIELRKNKDIIALNAGIKKIATDYNLVYINIFDLLRDEKNELRSDLTIDGLHLNGEGYKIWAEAVKPYILCH